MADDVKALLLQVDASVALAQANMLKLARTVDAQTGAMQANLTKLDKGFAGLGGGIGKATAALAGFAGGIAGGLLAQLPGQMIAIGKASLSTAADLGEVADSLGVNVEFLQKFRFAATQTGASIEDADGALGKFAKTTGSALNGNKEAIASFARLGITQADLAANANNLPGLFVQFADAISKVPDPARQSADALAIIGRGGTSLLPLLKSGADGFNELAVAAEKLGLVIPRDLIDRADEFNDKMAAMKQVVDAQFAKVIVENANGLLALAGALASVVAAAGDAGTQLRGTKEYFARNGADAGILFQSADDLRNLGDPNRRSVMDGANYIQRVARGNSSPATTGLRFTIQNMFDTYSPPKPKASAGGGSGGGTINKVGSRTAKNTPLSDLLLRMGGNGADTIDLGVERLGELADLRFDGPLASLKDLQPAMVELSVATETWVDGLDKAGYAAEGLNQDLARGLADAAFFGGSVGDVLVTSFKRAGAALLESGLLSFFNPSGAPGGGLGGSLLKGFGSLFSGKGFAAGGQPPVGKFSLVGENGPELRYFGAPSTIIPMRGGSNYGAGLTINVDARGSTDPAMVEAAAIRGAQRALAGAGDSMRRLTRQPLRGGLG